MRRNAQQRLSAATKATTRPRVPAAGRKRSIGADLRVGADEVARDGGHLAASRGLSASVSVQAIGGSVVMGVPCTFGST
jgi:hypothetical protein